MEARSRNLIPGLLAALAVGHIGLGGWQLIAPHSFFEQLGPFGAYNPHYARDVGTFTLALGAGFAISYRWPVWRVGVVGYAFLQYSFHAINHLADIGKASPKRVGPIDFALIAATAAVLGWMLVRVVRERREGPA